MFAPPRRSGGTSSSRVSPPSSNTAAGVPPPQRRSPSLASGGGGDVGRSASLLRGTTPANSPSSVFHAAASNAAFTHYPIAQHADGDHSIMYNGPSYGGDGAAAVRPKERSVSAFLSRILNDEEGDNDTEGHRTGSSRPADRFSVDPPPRTAHAAAAMNSTEPKKATALDVYWASMHGAAAHPPDERRAASQHGEGGVGEGHRHGVATGSDVGGGEWRAVHRHTSSTSSPPSSQQRNYPHDGADDSDRRMAAVGSSPNRIRYHLSHHGGGTSNNGGEHDATTGMRGATAATLAVAKPTASSGSGKGFATTNYGADSIPTASSLRAMIDESYAAFKEEQQEEMQARPRPPPLPRGADAGLKPSTSNGPLPPSPASFFGDVDGVSRIHKSSIDGDIEDDYAVDDHYYADSVVGGVDDINNNNSSTSAGVGGSGLGIVYIADGLEGIDKALSRVNSAMPSGNRNNGGQAGAAVPTGRRQHSAMHHHPSSALTPLTLSAVAASADHRDRRTSVVSITTPLSRNASVVTPTRRGGGGSSSAFGGGGAGGRSRAASGVSVSSWSINNMAASSRGAGPPPLSHLARSAVVEVPSFRNHSHEQQHLHRKGRAIGAADEYSSGGDDDADAKERDAKEKHSGPAAIVAVASLAAAAKALPPTPSKSSIILQQKGSIEDLLRHLESHEARGNALAEENNQMKEAMARLSEDYDALAGRYEQQCLEEPLRVLVASEESSRQFLQRLLLDTLRGLHLQLMGDFIYPFQGTLNALRQQHKTSLKLAVEDAVSETERDCQLLMENAIEGQKAASMEAIQQTEQSAQTAVRAANEEVERLAALVASVDSERRQLEDRVAMLVAAEEKRVASRVEMGGTQTPFIIADGGDGVGGDAVVSGGSFSSFPTTSSANPLLIGVITEAVAAEAEALREGTARLEAILERQRFEYEGGGGGGGHASEFTATNAAPTIGSSLASVAAAMAAEPSTPLLRPKTALERLACALEEGEAVFERASAVFSGGNGNVSGIGSEQQQRPSLHSPSRRRVATSQSNTTATENDTPLLPPTLTASEEFTLLQRYWPQSVTARSKAVGSADDEASAMIGVSILSPDERLGIFASEEGTAYFADQFNAAMEALMASDSFIERRIGLLRREYAAVYKHYVTYGGSRRRGVGGIGSGGDTDDAAEHHHTSNAMYNRSTATTVGSSFGASTSSSSPFNRSSGGGGGDEESVSMMAMGSPSSSSQRHQAYKNIFESYGRSAASSLMTAFLLRNGEGIMGSPPIASASTASLMQPAAVSVNGLALVDRGHDAMALPPPPPPPPTVRDASIGTDKVAAVTAGTLTVAPSHVSCGTQCGGFDAGGRRGSRNASDDGDDDAFVVVKRPSAPSNLVAVGGRAIDTARPSPDDVPLTPPPATTASTLLLGGGGAGGQVFVGALTTDGLAQTDRIPLLSHSERHQSTNTNSVTSQLLTELLQSPQLPLLFSFAGGEDGAGSAAVHTATATSTASSSSSAAMVRRLQQYLCELEAARDRLTEIEPTHDANAERLVKTESELRKLTKRLAVIASEKVQIQSQLTALKGDAAMHRTTAHNALVNATSYRKMVEVFKQKYLATHEAFLKCRWELSEIEEALGQTKTTEKKADNGGGAGADSSSSPSSSSFSSSLPLDIAQQLLSDRLASLEEDHVKAMSAALTMRCEEALLRELVDAATLSRLAGDGKGGDVTVDDGDEESPKADGGGGVEGTSAAAASNARRKNSLVADLLSQLGAPHSIVEGEGNGSSNSSPSSSTAAAAPYSSFNPIDAALLALQQQLLYSELKVAADGLRECLDDVIGFRVGLAKGEYTVSVTGAANNSNVSRGDDLSDGYDDEYGDEYRVGSRRGSTGGGAPAISHQLMPVAVATQHAESLGRQLHRCLVGTIHKILDRSTLVNDPQQYLHHQHQSGTSGAMDRLLSLQEEREQRRRSSTAVAACPSSVAAEQNGRLDGRRRHQSTPRQHSRPTTPLDGGGAAGRSSRGGAQADVNSANYQGSRRHSSSSFGDAGAPAARHAMDASSVTHLSVLSRIAQGYEEEEQQRGPQQQPRVGGEFGFASPPSRRGGHGDDSDDGNPQPHRWSSPISPSMAQRRGSAVNVVVPPSRAIHHQQSFAVPQSARESATSSRRSSFKA